MSREIPELSVETVELAKELSPKELKAADEYLANGGVKATALRAAGLSKSNRMFDKPKVQAYLESRTVDNMRQLGIEQQDVLRTILESLEVATGKRPTKKVAFHHESGEFVERDVSETNLTAVAKFTEQLGKSISMFTDKVEHQGMSVAFEVNYGPKKIERVVSEE